MAYFGKFYLDKEKDMVVRLDLEGTTMSYTIYTENHQSNNLIKNFAIAANQETVIKNDRIVIAGEIPCFIEGDGQRVYIL